MGLYPNAYTTINNKRVKILESIPYDDFHLNLMGVRHKESTSESSYYDKSPGHIITKVKGIGLLVSTNDIPILITKVKIEGKSESSADILIQQISSLGNSFSMDN